jgi:hypothetical protein
MPLTVVEITCSRCHRWVEGYQLEDGTAGYVDVQGGRWHRYARPGETRLCDACLMDDPGYRKDYPYAADHLRMAGLG